MIAPARTDRSLFSEWWWTIDRMMLATILGLAFAGAALSLAASPPMAQRLGYDTTYFILRHGMFLVPAVITVILVSMLPLRHVRILALCVLAVSLIAMGLILLVGTEVNGARRWFRVGPLGLQPSEFMKPALIVTSAWLLARGSEGRGGLWDGPLVGGALSLVLLGGVAALLILQPDIGQTVLVTAAWSTMVFVAGIPFAWTAVLGAGGAAALVVGYFHVPHVTDRIDAFLNPAENDTHQVDTALNAFMNGGLFGQGPGEGQIKRHIPDAHTDFVFAVAAEEYGILVCLMIVGLFAFLVARGLARALSTVDRFVQLAVSGLVALIGFQAAINIGVAVKLLPAKGMTLPFLSYGGSSLLASGLTCGMILALTRSWASPRHVGL